MGYLSDQMKLSKDWQKFKKLRHREDKSAPPGAPTIGSLGTKYSREFILKVREDANFRHACNGKEIKIDTVAKRYKIPVMHARKMKTMKFEDIGD